MAFKILPIFGRNKEEETLKAVVELMEEIKRANRAFRDCVKLWLDDDYERMIEKVHDIEAFEKEADKINLSIDSKLFGGAFLPGTRTHLHELAEALDDIIDIMMHTAQTFWYMKDKKFPEEIKSSFWKLSEEARKAVDKMVEVLNDLLENKEEIMDHINEAKELEHNCDVLKKEILEKVYFGRKEAVTNTLMINLASMMSEIGDTVEVACRKVAVLRLLRQA